jgi:hypothetical protein
MIADRGIKFRAEARKLRLKVRVLLNAEYSQRANIEQTGLPLDEQDVIGVSFLAIGNCV